MVDSEEKNIIEQKESLDKIDSNKNSNFSDDIKENLVSKTEDNGNYRNELKTKNPSRNIFSLIGFIFGFAGIAQGVLSSFVYMLGSYGWTLPVAAIIFGSIGYNKSKIMGSGHGQAVTAIVLGIVGTGLDALGITISLMMSAFGLSFGILPSPF